MSARERTPGAWTLGAVAILGLMPWVPAWAQDAAPAAPAPPTQSEISTVIGEAQNIIDRKANDEDVFTFDYGVPSAPALTLLGVAEDQITQSNSLKPFIVSLPGVFSSKETGQAVALDMSPAWLVTRRGERSYANYSGGMPLWFRTRFGVALYEGVDDADPAKQKPSRLAVGLSSSIFDWSDPLLASAPGMKGSAWTTCFKSGASVISSSMPPPITSEELASLQKQYDEYDRRVRVLERMGSRTTEQDAELASNKALRQTTSASYAKIISDWRNEAAAKFAKSEGEQVVTGCMKVADRAARIGTDFDVGGGAVWEGRPGKLEGLANPSAIFWASFRTSFGVSRPKGYDYRSLIKWADDNSSWFMLGGSGRVGFSEAVATGDAAKPKIRANTYSGWIGIERYSETNRFTAQIGVRRTDPRLPADSAFAGTQTVYHVSFDQKMTDSIWLSLAYGRAEGAGALKDDSTVRVRLTFDSPGVRNIFK